MELDYSEMLWRKKWLIILVTLATTAITLAVSFALPKVYKSNATLLVGEGQLSSKDYFGEIQASVQMAKSYSSVFISPTILRSVNKMDNLGIPNKELEDKISIEQVVETPLIRITVADTNRARSQKIARGLTQVIVDYTDNFYEKGVEEADQTIETELQQVEKDIIKAKKEGNKTKELAASGQRKLILNRYEDLLAKNPIGRVKIIEPASFPREPSSPQIFLNGIVALFAGLWLGIGMAALGEWINKKRLKYGDERKTVAF